MDIHAKPTADVKQLNICERKFQELGWAIESKSQEEPNAPVENAKLRASQLGPSWLSDNATQRLLDFLRKANRDEKGSPGHRMRLYLATPGNELRISPSDYNHIARELIGNG